MQGLDSTFKDAWGLQCWGVQWGTSQICFLLGFGTLWKSSLSLTPPTLPPNRLPWVVRGSYPVVVRCGWEKMCNSLSPPSLPIQRPWHKLLSILMGSKIFFLHLRVKLRSHQWVAKLNSCLCFKVDWKSLGQCPKSSYFCHLRLRGLFLGTKSPLANTRQRSGLVQRWMNRFAFPVARKRKKASSLNLSLN